MRWRACVVISSLLFVLFTNTGASWADPVSTSAAPLRRITSGELFFLWDTDDPFVRGTVSGTGFQLFLEDVELRPAGGSVVVAHPVSGTLQVGDQLFPLDFEHPAVISWLIKTAAFVVPPTIPPGVDFFEKQYPFDFAGRLSVTTSQNQMTPFDLIGKGVATDQIFDANAGTGEPPLFKLSGSTLTFFSPSPVPEPGAILLVATGGVLFAARRCRRSWRDLRARCRRSNLREHEGI